MLFAVKIAVCDFLVVAYACSRSLTSVSTILICRCCYGLIKFSSKGVVITGLSIRTDIYDKLTISNEIYTHLSLSAIDIEVAIGYVSSIVCVCIWIGRICRTVCFSIWVFSAPIIQEPLVVQSDSI